MEEELRGIRQHLKEDFADVNWEEPGLEEMRSRLMYLLEEAGRQLDMVYGRNGEKEKGEKYGECGTDAGSLS